MATFTGRDRGPGIDVPTFMASLALNVLGLLMPLSILMIFDRVIPFQSLDTLVMLGLALLVSAVFEFLMRWARSTVLGAAAVGASIRNHRTFLERVVTANPRSFSKDSAASYLDRYAAISRLRDYFSGQNQALATDLPFTVLFVAMVGLIGGWLFLVPVAGFFAIAVFAGLMKRAQSDIFDVRKSIDKRRYAFLAEVLGNMSTVKANTMERQMTRRFELLQQKTVENSHGLILFSGFAQNYGAVFSQFMVAAMGLMGAFFVIRADIGIAELAACMMLNGRIIQPLMKLMTFWVQSESISMSKGKLNDMEDLPILHGPAIQHIPLRGHVELSDLVLGSASGATLAEAIEARVSPGDAGLLVADDRRAVPELFSVMLGHSSPQAGRVVVDGSETRDRVVHRGRGGLVCLETRPAVFSGTLLENISAFGSGEQIEKSVEIAAQLGLEKRVNRLPMGYNTRLNSGGYFEKDPVNRQLISLVRVLALEPKILLMNEPTAVLESQDREAFAAVLRSRLPDLTLIFATPDPRMRDIATQTIDMPRQNITEAFEEDAKQDSANLRMDVPA